MNATIMLGLLLAAGGAGPTSLVELHQTRGPLQVVQLSTGTVVLDLPEGRREVRLTLPPGRYAVRRPGEKFSRIFAQTIDVEVGKTVRVEETNLTLAGVSKPLANGGEVASSDDSRRKTLMTWAITSGAVAVAALAAGVTLFADAQSRANLDDQLLELGAQPTRVSSTLQNEQVAGYVLVPAGVALAVTSVILFRCLPPSVQSAAAGWSAGIGPRGVGLSGNF